MFQLMNLQEWSQLQHMKFSQPHPKIDICVASQCIGNEQCAWEKRLQHANAMIEKLPNRQSDIVTAKNILSQHMSGNAYNLIVAQLAMSLRRNIKYCRENMELYCLYLYYKSPVHIDFLDKFLTVDKLLDLKTYVLLDLTTVLENRPWWSWPQGYFPAGNNL